VVVVGEALSPVIPAKAGIHGATTYEACPTRFTWIPAFAGMTKGRRFPLGEHD
jgi:hypothetical protein